MRIDGIDRGVLRDALSQLPPEMAHEAEAIARRARASAPLVEDRNGGPGEVPLPIKVETSSGKFGARATVILAHPAGLAVEAKHALLARSV